MFRLVRNPDPRKKPPYGSRLDPYHPLSQGLVGCWLMNEGGGNKAYNLVSCYNYGILTDNAKWEIGTYGIGTTFPTDNGTDRINLGSVDSSNPLSGVPTGELSIIAQVYQVSQSDLNNSYPRIIDKSDGGSALDGWFLGRDVIGTDENYAFFVDGTKYVYSGYHNEAGLFHIAGTFKSGNNAIYVNGKNDTASGDTSTYTFPNVTTNAAIGNWNHTTDRQWNGTIFYVYVYNRALTDSEILQLYKEPYGHILAPQYWYMVDFGAAAGTTYYQNVSGTMGTITGSIAKAVSVTRLGSMPAPSGSIAKQISVSRYGNLPSPNGEVSTPGNYSQSLTGNLPAPTGSLTKTIAKNLAGIMGTITGSISRATSKLLSGAMPKPNGSLSHAFNTSQSVSGIMGAITGVLTTIKNPVSSAVKLLKIIGSSFKKLID